MKTCDEFRARLSAYLDGEAGDEEEAIRGHVEACNTCRRMLDGFRHVSGRIRDVAEGEPATLVENIRRRVREEGPRLRGMNRGGMDWIPKFAAAAAILAALLWTGVFLESAGDEAIRLSNLAPTDDLSETERRILFDQPPTDNELLVSILSGESPR